MGPQGLSHSPNIKSHLKVILKKNTCILYLFPRGPDLFVRGQFGAPAVLDVNPDTSNIPVLVFQEKVGNI